MSWILAIGLALAAFLLVAFVLKAPRSGWTAVGAALLFGIAGYALQARPGLAGAPKPYTEPFAEDAAAIVEARRIFSGSDLPPSNKWVVIADGLARNGQYDNAVEVLLGALDDDPDNAEAWLALANSLVAHADGLLTPAALYAYRKARDAAPDAPGPPFFLGLALAQSGRFAEARELWSKLLERAPADAPWREFVELQLNKLDGIIKQAGRAAQSH